PLPYDPEQKYHEFHTIERDIRRQLGEFNLAGQIMARMCQEYREVVGLLSSRGTRGFAEISERLYGSASDSFHAGEPSLSHLGTTLNGQLQPVCTFLSKGPPSSTVTQEGLAVLTEIFAFASHPGRVRRLTNRIEGVALAEAGANFLEVYRYFQTEGYDPRESYQHTMRIFRGSLPEGCGPFTKDLCYSKGFVLVYNYIRLAVSRGLVRRVPLLFCGKTTLADIKTLAQLVDEGLVTPPRFMPPQFADLHALSAWMCYANFLNRLSLKRIEEDYAGLF